MRRMQDRPVPISGPDSTVSRRIPRRYRPCMPWLRRRIGFFRSFLQLPEKLPWIAGTRCFYPEYRRSRKRSLSATIPTLEGRFCLPNGDNSFLWIWSPCWPSFGRKPIPRSWYPQPEFYKSLWSIYRPEYAPTWSRRGIQKYNCAPAYSSRSAANFETFFFSFGGKYSINWLIIWVYCRAYFS